MIVKTTLFYFCIPLTIDPLSFNIYSHSIYHPRLFCKQRDGRTIVSENTGLVVAVLITDCVSLGGYSSFVDFMYINLNN